MTMWAFQEEQPHIEQSLLGQATWIHLWMKIQICFLAGPRWLSSLSVVDLLQAIRCCAGHREEVRSLKRHPGPVFDAGSMPLNHITCPFLLEHWEEACHLSGRDFSVHSMESGGF